MKKVSREKVIPEVKDHPGEIPSLEEDIEDDNEIRFC